MAKIILLFLLLVFFTLSFKALAAPKKLTSNIANASDDIILVAERSTFEGLEQVSLSISDQTNIRFVANSNFLLPKLPARLGVFVSSDFSALKNTLQEIGQSPNNHSKNKKKSIYKSPHRIKVLINNEEIEQDDPKYNKVLDLLVDSQKKVKWEKQKGIVIKDKKELKSFKCAPSEGKTQVCTSKMGMVRLGKL